MTIDDIILQKDYKSLFILSRYFYRIGDPLLDDKTYDAIENLMKSQYPDMAVYCNRSYDDDPVPVDLLTQIGVEPVKFISLTNKGELYSYLNEEKSTSIESSVSYEEAFEYFKFLATEHLDFTASLKMDGDNTKMLYENGEFAISMSRGRNGDAFDFTEGSSRVVPRLLSSKSKYTKVTGESYVDEAALPYLRQKYNNNKYKTAKSSAMSMLRVLHDREDYKYLSTRVFMAEGIADTMTEMFTKLVEDGFEVPPYRFFKWEDIPMEFDTFKIWLKENILDPIWDEGLGIPSDGVVIEVNDLTWIGNQKNQYNNRNHALKFDHWKFKCEKGIITGIKIEQRRVFKSVRVTIEPMITYDGCEARVINSFDPSILIKNDLYVGKEVFFEKNAGAVNILIHGERLKTMLKNDEV